MKKSISILLCVVMLLGMVVTASAANSFSGAKNYSMSSTASATVLGKGDTSTYAFKVAKSGKINFNVNSDLAYMYIQLYDQNGNKILTNSLYANNSTKKISESIDWYLNTGSYFLLVETQHYVGSYQFKLTETPANETFFENYGGNNNTTSDADFITYGNKYVGCLSVDDKTDVYKFTLHEAGNMAFDLSANIPSLAIKLFDENGAQLWNKTSNATTTSNETKFIENLHLRKGTYYLSFESSQSGVYNFTFAFTSANESFVETFVSNNDLTSSANQINMNQQYYGQLALNEKKDSYKIQVTSRYPRIAIYSQMPYLNFEIFDMKGKQVWYDGIYANSSTKTINYIKELKLSPGAYYITVSANSNYGTYSFYLTNGSKIVDTPYTNRTITVKVNGKYIPFPQAPVLESGTTLVPLRAIFEALEADVQWNNATKTITSTKNGTKIVMQIGSKKMYINGVEKTLNLPARLVNGTTLVPVRAVSEAFNCKVSWESATQTVVIQK